MIIISATKMIRSTEKGSVLHTTTNSGITVISIVTIARNTEKGTLPLLEE